MVYLQLFLSFVKIGLLGFGGGMAIIGLIQQEVERYGWMTQTEFVDIVAISQMTPGPIGINCATYVGYTATNSILGSIVATCSIILPSLIIMLIISRLYLKIQSKWSENKIYQRTMLVIRALVIGLIATACIKLMSPESFIGPISWVIFAAVFAGTLLPQFVKNTPLVKRLTHPITLIILAGIFGYLIYGTSSSDVRECFESGSGKIAQQIMVNKTLKKLSTREKVAQLVMVPTCSYNDSASEARIHQLVEEQGIGGVIMMHDSLTRSVAYMNDLQSRANIPLLVAVDGEWGPSMRYAEFPFFPRQMQLGALPNDSLIYRMGRAVGEQCRMAGIHINFAPVVDINNNPDNAAIGTRSFGERREWVANYGSAYMRGMQDAGIAACAKHFPGHGDTNVDSHKALPILPFTRQRLDSMELYPFRRLIGDGVKMVMLGHLHIPALDSAVSSISKPIVTDLLQKELGFEGVVVTDALVMKGVAEGREGAEVMKLAYAAGVDILLMPGDPIGGIDLITKAIESGEFAEKDLDRRVKKVLKMKAEVGILNGYQPIDTTDIVKRVNRPEDQELIEEIARQSVTRVRYTPIERSKRVAYLGYHAEYRQAARFYGNVEGLSGFGGASGVQEDGTTLAYNLLKDSLQADYYPLLLNATEQDLNKVLRQLEAYDEVILAVHDLSGRPASELITDPRQDALLAQWVPQHNVHCIWFGNPYALNAHPWLEQCGSLIFAYADTGANERAAVGVLLGQLPALGTLPVLCDKQKKGTVLPYTDAIFNKVVFKSWFLDKKFGYVNKKQ